MGSATWGYPQARSPRLRLTPLGGEVASKSDSCSIRIPSPIVRALRYEPRLSLLRSIRRSIPETGASANAQDAHWEGPAGPQCAADEEEELPSDSTLSYARTSSPDVRI